MFYALLLLTNELFITYLSLSSCRHMLQVQVVILNVCSDNARSFLPFVRGFYQTHFGIIML